MDKQTLLDKIQREAELWNTLLQEIGEARMEQPGAAGNWTFKDVVAHLSAWRSGTLERLEAARHDRAPVGNFWPAGWDEEEDIEEINAWIYAENHDRSLPDVLNESRNQFTHMRELVRALPEAALFDAQRYEWMEDRPLADVINFNHFYEEHEPSLRQWIASK